MCHVCRSTMITSRLAPILGQVAHAAAIEAGVVVGRLASAAGSICLASSTTTVAATSSISLGLPLLAARQVSVTLLACTGALPFLQHDTQVLLHHPRLSAVLVAVKGHLPHQTGEAESKVISFLTTTERETVQSLWSRCSIAGRTRSTPPRAVAMESHACLACRQG